MVVVINNSQMKKIKFIIIILTFNIIQSQNSNNDSSSFMPESGQYIVSGWVKEKHPLQVVTYTSYISVIITGLSTPSNFNLQPSGAIIDGWQRIVGIIEIPSIVNPGHSPTIEIALQCDNISGLECYFDDIRFYPFNGNLKSFVYDEDTQRLMAELDENNYATFYEYDLEGGLVRVKKETERGIYTIQETRSNNPKKQ